MRQLLTLRPLVVAAIVVLAWVFALPQACFACSCALPGPPLVEADKASAVFRAQIASSEQVTSPQGSRYRRVTMRVTEVWKGNVSAETLVYTGNDSADCGFIFQQGGDCLVYAYAVAPGGAIADWPVGALATGLCNRTRPIVQAGDDLAAFGAGQPPTPGLPNTGAGAATIPATTRLIPGELLLGGGILAALALAWGGNILIARRRA